MHGVQKDLGSRKLLVSLILICVLAGVICSARALSHTAAISNTGSVQYPPPPSSSIHAEGTKLFDLNGDEVVFNGIDSRGLLGYWMYSDTCYLSASDVQVISARATRSHGLNLLRVDISLSMALRDQSVTMETPTQLQYYSNFWTKLDEVVNACTQNRIWLSICFGVSDGYWANWGGQGGGFPYWMYDGTWKDVNGNLYNKAYTNDSTGILNAMRDFWNTNNPTAANVRTAYQTFWKDIVTRYKNVPNVMFNFFNEPLETWTYGNLYPIPDYNNPSSDWVNLRTCFQGFIEGMVDQTRVIDGGSHLTVFCVGAFPGFTSYPHHAWNLQIRRPNILVEDHNYHTPVVDYITAQANNAFRYNQPFLLGEFGGIEDGGDLAQTPSDTVLTMQTCNQLDVSWSYLRYNTATPAPSPATWLLLEANLSPNARFYAP